MEETEFKEYLSTNGLSDIAFWSPILKNFGIVSLDTLKQHYNKTSIIEELAVKARNETEKTEIFQVFTVDQTMQNEIQQKIFEVNGKIVIQPTTISERDASIILHTCSEGNALRGILIAQHQTPKSFLKKAQLIEVLPVLESKKDDNTKNIKFNSEDEETDFRHTLKAAGFSKATGNQKNRSTQRSRRQRKEYFSTAKYRLMIAAETQFKIENISLSDDAKHHLASIKRQSKNTDSKPYYDFFEKFGSHVSSGPHQFGGWCMWICSSRGFSDTEKQIVMKMQSDLLSIMDTTIIEPEKINEIKKKYSEKCSETTLNNTTMHFYSSGRPELHESIEDWKENLIRDSSTWVLLEQGTDQIAVWDIIKEKYPQLCDINLLIATWEKLSGLVVGKVKKYETRVVLDKIKGWKESTLSLTEAKEKLDFILDVKNEVVKATGETRWINEYLSQEPMQLFLQTVINSKLTYSSIEGIELKMQSIVKVEDMDLVKGFFDMSNRHLVLNWILCSNLPEHAAVDFERFDHFLNDLRKKSDISEENLAKCVTEFITCLTLRYEDTHYKVFICIILQPYQMECFNPLSIRKLSFDDVECLQKHFVEEKQQFFHYCDSNGQCVRLYLILLTLRKCQDLLTPHKLFIRNAFDAIKDLQPSLDKSILQKLCQFTVDFDILSLRNAVEFKLNDLQLKTKSTYSVQEVHASCSLMDILQTKFVPENNYFQQDNSKLSTDNSHALSVLKDLGLTELYPKKLSLKDATSVSLETIKMSLGDISISDLKQLPMLVLHKLMSYDHTCRQHLISVPKPKSKNTGSSSRKKYDDYESEEDDSSVLPEQRSIHPVDCIIAILLCSDPFLCQDLLCRMSKCQLAIPLILPDPFNGKLNILLWSLRSILKNWKTVQETEEKDVIHSIVTYKMPIVSFLRFGTQSSFSSKSKIINEVISDDNYDRFFHRHCRGGEYQYVLAGGLVDMSWYIPGEDKAQNIFSDVITFLNLHGDARNYPCQTNFVAKISTVCIILLTEPDIELNDQMKSELCPLRDRITFLNGVDQKPKKLREDFKSSSYISLKGKNDSKLKDLLREHIKSFLQSTTQFDSIEKLCLQHNEGLVLDEKNGAFKIGFNYAKKLSKLIINSETGKCIAKDSILPLQGESLWKEWAYYDKEVNRLNMKGKLTVEEYKEKVIKLKKDIRAQQLLKLQNLSPVIQLFLKSLFMFEGGKNCVLRNFFIQNLKLELESMSRQEILQMQEEYYELIKKLAFLSNDKSPKNDEQLKRVVELREEVETLQNSIMNSSFGVEHLIRELGQMYEAASELPEYDKILISKLPKIAAELLIDGNPLELMDGDVGHVPLNWIKAVLVNTVERLNNPNVFVLSVLGLQSTGKSTMLNTTFGLKLRVSGGRCTRGAFMQLITVDEDLKHLIHCDYIIVIDVEGLRAPEVDALKVLKHDNELATLVIGLANMTLINIYGEVPGDIDDILQTAVHAFLRMTKVQYSPSCQFIHQNANDSFKNEVARSQFLQKLDSFTVLAAKEEDCEREYQHFNDVIKFNNKTDVHFFNGLWKGDPPMAPINAGYSHSSQKLKHHCIRMIKQISQPLKEGTYADLRLSSFIIKFGDLWNALLKEKFVFSFKNTLEIIAYKRMEEEFHKWDGILQRKISEWEEKAENEIATESLESLQELLKLKHEDLYAIIQEESDNIKKKMELFFNGERGEVLWKWKANCEIRFDLVVAEVSDSAIYRCNKHVKRREAIRDFEATKKRNIEWIQEHVQMHIERITKEQEKLLADLAGESLNEKQMQYLIKRDLFNDENLNNYVQQEIISPSEAEGVKQAKHIANSSSHDILREILFTSLTQDQVIKIVTKMQQTEEDLNNTFEEIWKNLLNKFSPDDSLKNTVTVKQHIQHELLSRVAPLGRSGKMIEMLNAKKNKDLHIDLKKDYHYTIAKTSWYSRQPEEHICKKQAHEVNTIVFRKVRRYISDTTSKDMDFRPTLVQKLLQDIDDTIQEHLEKEGFTIRLTQSYQLEVYVAACVYAEDKFEKMAELYDQKHDPRNYLTKNEKRPLYVKFVSQFKKAEAEIVIIDTVIEYLETAITEQVQKSAGTKLVMDMRASEPYFANKMVLKEKILKDLQHGTFDKYEKYLTDIELILISHVTKYVIQYCDESNDTTGVSRLQAKVMNEVSQIVKSVKEIVIKVEAPNVSEWIQQFCKHKELRREIAFNIEPKGLLLGYDLCQNLDLTGFKHNFCSKLDKLEKKIQLSFDNIKCEDEMSHWREKPHITLKSLIGCTAQCPFCGEQCDLMAHDTKDTLHRTEVHRPDCLAGWRFEKTKIMDITVCPVLVASEDTKFRKLPDKNYYHTKEYRKRFPDWDITPKLNSDSENYWKWFVVKFRDELAKTYSANSPNIPDSWKQITMLEATKDVENCFSH